jgi:hypothetical protein
MHHDPRSRITSNRRFEYFSNPNLRCIDRAMIHLDNIQQVIARVEQQHAQMFLLQCGHFILHQRGRICGAVDGRTLLG